MNKPSITLIIVSFLSSLHFGAMAETAYDENPIGFEVQTENLWDYFKGFTYHGDVDGSVLLQSDTPPKFNPGVNDFFRRHFKYPEDAWKAEKLRAVTVDCVIRKDGTVTGVECQKVKHPALLREIVRVAEKMRWTPAMHGGEKVNVYKSFYVDLNPGTSGGSTVPYGLESAEKQGRQSAASLKRCTVVKDTPSFEENVAKLRKGAELFPEYTYISQPYVRLLSALGDAAGAVAMSDSCLRAYNKFRYVQGNPDIRPPRNDYSGRTEIGLALMGLIQRKYVAGEAENAFNDVCDLIDRRVADGDLYDQAVDYSVSVKKIERMERDLVMEYSNGTANIDLNTSTWEKVSREYSINELSYSLRYWAKRGQINNAQIEQLTALIDQEYDYMTKGKGIKNPDKINLFGVKALAIWLQGGEEAMRGYVSEIKGGQASDKLVKYLEKLEKRYDEKMLVLTDRSKVIESLACLMPPKGTGEADVQAFYDCRKAVEEVFPVKWLRK